MTKVFVHGNPETAAVWAPLVEALAGRGLADEVVLLSPPGFGSPVPEGWDALPASYVGWLVEQLEGLASAGGGPIDLVGHDWGAGHLFGLLAERPDLVRSWAADCVGLLHPDYVWHDMAQTWQTEEAGEESVAGQAAIGAEGLTEIYRGLGLPEASARSMAEAFDEDMGRCILALYRGARQPALADLGRRLVAAELPPGLVIDATADPYVGSDLANEMVEPLGAGHLLLADRGHWWMAEDAGSAADGLLAFWADLDGGGQTV